jgi:hypothetical protein
MATITLTGNTTYSTLTVANGDTINLDGFALTIGAQPSETNITVNTPGKAGTVTISGGYDLSTWSFTAGTAVLITTIPSGCTIGTLNGGAAAGATTNNGSVTTVNGGTGTNIVGIGTNNGTVTNANGAAASGSIAVNINAGTITNATAGSAANAHGCSTNNGTITTATGGSASAAHGCSTNNATVISAAGGTNAAAYGISLNNGTCLKLDDNTGAAINTFRGTVFFCFGPDILGSIKAPITTIYSLGKMSTSATLPVGSTLIEMKEGLTGGGFPLSRIVN